MENSLIEWTDHTFNGWIGCTKVSPGCTHCYAETLNKRWKKGANWGKGAPRQRTSAANWKKPLKWNKDVWAECPKCGVKQPHGDICIVPDCLTLGSEMKRLRPRVFCASLADIFDDEVPHQWRGDFFHLVDQCPNLDFLILTKRPENIRRHIWEMSNGAFENGEMFQYMPNVWLGTTVEDQARADERLPHLLSIPAKVRFLSCEPLLENVDLTKATYFRDANLEPQGGLFGSMLNSLDWVICGGESGPGARPMHPDWARSLRDQCQSEGVPFFMKQMEVDGKMTGEIERFPEDLRIREFPDTSPESASPADTLRDAARATSRGGKENREDFQPCVAPSVVNARIGASDL